MKPILALTLGLSACTSPEPLEPALSVASTGGMDWSREFSFTANVTASNPTSENVAFWGVNGEEPVARYKYFWEGQWVEDEAVWQTCGTGLYVGELSAGGTVDLDAYISYPQLPSKVGVGFWKPSEDQMPAWFEWDWYWTDVGALDFSSHTPSQQPESPPSLRFVDAKGLLAQELFIYFKVPRGEDLTQTSRRGHIWLQDSVKSTPLSLAVPRVFTRTARRSAKVFTRTARRSAKVFTRTARRSAKVMRASALGVVPRLRRTVALALSGGMRECGIDTAR